MDGVTIPTGARPTTMTFAIDLWSMLEAIAYVAECGLPCRRVHVFGDRILAWVGSEAEEFGRAEYISYPQLGISVSYVFDREVAELGRELEQWRIDEAEV